MKWYYIILIIILVGAVIYYYLYPLYLQYTLRKIAVDLLTSLNNNNVEYWFVATTSTAASTVCSGFAR